MSQSLALMDLIEKFSWSNPGSKAALSTSASSLENGTADDEVSMVPMSRKADQSRIKYNGTKGNSAKERGKNYQAKLKTEACKMYQLGFICPYGDRCSFAHGTSELKQKQSMSAKYKSVCCTEFHKKSYCQYGARCHFIHKRKSKDNFKPLKAKYQQVLDCLQNSCEPIGKTKKNQYHSNLANQSFLEIFKLPKLSVFESIRS